MIPAPDLLLQEQQVGLRLLGQARLDAGIRRQHDVKTFTAFQIINYLKLT